MSTDLTDTLDITDGFRLRENSFPDQPFQVKATTDQTAQNDSFEDLDPMDEIFEARGDAIHVSHYTEERSLMLSTDLDYAVVKITDCSSLAPTFNTKIDLSLMRHTYIISTGPKDTGVIAYIPSNGFLTGTLDGTPNIFSSTQRQHFPGGLQSLF